MSRVLLSNVLQQTVRSAGWQSHQQPPVTQNAVNCIIQQNQPD